MAATFDYEAAISAVQVNENMVGDGDFALPHSMRQRARLWLAAEYETKIKRLIPGIFVEVDLVVRGKWLLPGAGYRARTVIFMNAHMMLGKKRIWRAFR